MAPKKNAFFYFMLDFKNQHGRKFNSMAEVAEAAGPHWSRMSKAEKHPYEMRAKRDRENQTKLTTTGISVDLIAKQEREENEREAEMRTEISNLFQMANHNGSLENEMIFLIHINTFCYANSTGRHYPAEIAISCFTLKDGVSSDSVFHRIVKSGPLPLGYAAEAMLHSKETHQLPPPLSGDDEDNTQQVFSEMISFLSEKVMGSASLPILYAEERHMKMIRQVIDAWCSDFNEDPTQFKIYNMQYMFRVLKNTCHGENVWPTHSYSVREIEKDVYAHTTDIACDVHEVTTVQHCSKSFVIRYAYVICDNCCPALQLPLLQGYHVPFESIGAFRQGMSMSSKSSKSNMSVTTDSRSTFDDTSSLYSLNQTQSDMRSQDDHWETRSTISSTSTLTHVDQRDFPSLGRRGGPRGGGGYQSGSSWNNFAPNDASSYRSNAPSYSAASGSRAGYNYHRDTDRSDASSYYSDYSQSQDFPALGSRRGGIRGRGRGRGNPRGVY